MELPPVAHIFLTQARTAENACRHVERFLTDNPLLSYDQLHILPEEVNRADEEAFWDTMDEGLLANRSFAHRMISHLEKEGVKELRQLVDLQQGYATKVLHTLTHLLDGFIGIDSILYNLVDDSHDVSNNLRRAMRDNPSRYWLIRVRAGKVRASVLS
ncbi:MAG: hypothetical protein GX087_02520 [Desulfobulbaceae bacterium]|nr:hypothetical protein [Desulfobulbaceae bacterium]